MNAADSTVAQSHPSNRSRHARERRAGGQSLEGSLHQRGDRAVMAGDPAHRTPL